MKRARDAMDALSPNGSAYCSNGSKQYYVWLHTCKAADLLNSFMSFENIKTKTTMLTDTFFTSFQKTFLSVTDLLPQLEKWHRYNYDRKENDPYYRTNSFNPWHEFLIVSQVVDSAAEMVPQLNELYKKGNYSEMVDLLRSKDSTIKGAVVRHTQGILFYNYKVIDSLMLNRYEADLQKMAADGKRASIDSLLSHLEGNTRFLFPHVAARRKREIRKSMESQGYVALPKKAEPETAAEKKSAGTPVFLCFNSSMFNEADDRPKKDPTEKWLCLAPKLNHYGREQITETVFSSKDYFVVHPEEEKDMYTYGSRIAYIDGKELPADDENPCIFFANIEGVQPGTVEKAEVYCIGSRCIATIETDSLEFTWDAENHIIRFTGATFTDSILNEYGFESAESRFYLGWIGDVNRNGRIDLVVFGERNVFYFFEKRNDNTRTVLETVMSYSVYTAD